MHPAFLVCFWRNLFYSVVILGSFVAQRTGSRPGCADAVAVGIRPCHLDVSLVLNQCKLMPAVQRVCLWFETMTVDWTLQRSSSLHLEFQMRFVLCVCVSSSCDWRSLQTEPGPQGPGGRSGHRCSTGVSHTPPPPPAPPSSFCFTTSSCVCSHTWLHFANY